MDEENPWADAEASHTANPPQLTTTTTTTMVVTPTARPAPPPAPLPAPDLDIALPSKTGLLLLIFIHGFKGSAETTFEDFPSRLSHLLAETHPRLAVRSLVYPTYDTRGSLDVAVANFVEWLEEQVLLLEAKPEVDGETGKERRFEQTGRGGGKGTVHVALCGHSMGGLVAGDAALRIAKDNEAQGMGPYWPNVFAVIAYDSPYWGVHPNVFRYQATKYMSYAQQARDVGTHLAPIGAGIAAIWGMNRNQQQQQQQQQRDSSSGSSRWTKSLWTTGAFATAAAAVGGSVAAYYHREHIGGAYSWLTDHFEYVANLWDDSALRRRLNELVETRILFHAYYNVLPATTTGAGRQKKRTFIVLPPLSDARMARLVEPVEDDRAKDEIEAHVGMFTPSKNPTGYLRLVHGSAGLIGRRIVEGFESTAAQGQRESEQSGVPPPERDDGLRMGDEGLQEEEREVKEAMQEMRRERQRREGSAEDVEGSL